ncbi:MAG: cell wall hydrolase [Xanthobacteraceae bacterium]|nr:cell wall hydrolase [Xanthobacteraceae bacterium]
MQLDPQSRDLLIRTVYGEAGNQAPDGQSAVANVVLNRLNSGQFGKTVQDVVFAPNQFEPWSTRRPELMALRANSPAYLSAAAAVDSVLGENATDNTFGATHFLNPEIVKRRTGGTLPAWASGDPTATIGAHAFYNPQQRGTRVAVVDNDPNTWGAELFSGKQRNTPPRAQNNINVTVRPYEGNAQPRQAINETDPNTWGADLVGGNFNQLWQNADGSQLASKAAPLTMQESPLDPKINEVLARETQNPNPTVARNARIEQHIRDPREQVVRNAIYNNPITGALATIFPKETVVQGVLSGFSDEMLARIKSSLGQGVYDEVVQANRERLQRIHNENPAMAVAGEVAGNLTTVPVAGALNLFKGASALPRIANTTLSSAALSGLYGVGQGEGYEDKLNKGLEGTLWGGILGLGGEALVSGASALLRKGFGANRAPAPNVNPEQRIAENAEFNIPLTAGEATGNLRQMGWENAARNNAKGEYPGHQMQQFDARRADAVNTAVNETIGSRFGPRVAADQAGDMTAQAMRDKAALLRADADNAYSAAANKNAWIAADEVANLGKRVTDELEKAGIRLDTYGNYPGSQNAMNILKRVSGFEGAPQNGQVLAQSLEGLEQARKSLLKVRAGSAEDGRALGEIKKQFDNWISDAIDKRLFQGDPTALDDLKKARALWSQYKGMTAAERGPMQIISRMVNEERTGAEVANWLISSSTVGQAGISARVAARVKGIVGATSDEWQAIRSAAWDRVVNDATGNPRNAQQIAKAIEDLTRGNGKALASQLYSPAELGQMQRLAVAIRNTATDPRAFNPSRSGYELVRAMGDKLGLVIFGAGAGGASWATGDPRWLGLAALPVMRSASGAMKANAALNPLPSALGTTAAEIFRIPQHSVPALLNQN